MQMKQNGNPAMDLKILLNDLKSPRRNIPLITSSTHSKFRLNRLSHIY